VREKSITFIVHPQHPQHSQNAAVVAFKFAKVQWRINEKLSTRIMLTLNRRHCIALLLAVHIKIIAFGWLWSFGMPPACDATKGRASTKWYLINNVK